MTPLEKTARERAYRAVKIAVRQGRLTKPDHCQRCLSNERFGSDGRSLLHAHHHWGYGEPLSVVWLCVSCHGKEDFGVTGERHPCAKLTSSQVDAIRRRYVRVDFNKSNCVALAQEFGVSKRAIQDIVNRKTWLRRALEDA